MESQRPNKCCHCCGTTLQSDFKYCPQCGQEILDSSSSGSVKPSLECFSAFRNAKEKERSSFFVQKKGSKQAKAAGIEVKITIPFMGGDKVQQGHAMPLKVQSTSTPDENSQCCSGKACCI